MVVEWGYRRARTRNTGGRRRCLPAFYSGVEERIGGHGPQVQVSPLERWFLEEYTNLAQHLSRVRESLIRGKEPPISPEKKRGTILVRFLKEVPSIIGVDLKAHGPFLKEDIASLPWENADSLVRQGAAVEIQASEQENG